MKRISKIDMPPYFYQPNLSSESTVELDTETSHHIAQVLRMRVGEALHVTDGAGRLVLGRLSAVSKRVCHVAIEQDTRHAPVGRRVHIAIAPLKNSGRYEWFIEKATELGVASITPIQTARTEKLKLRMDRLRQIARSAMLQSQQVWLPEFPDAIPFADLISSWKDRGFQRLIAHCLPTSREPLSACGLSEEVGLLIGPEGDFTTDEIDAALDVGFTAVQLGETRLRTETAGIAAVTLLRLRN